MKQPLLFLFALSLASMLFYSCDTTAPSPPKVSSTPLQDNSGNTPAGSDYQPLSTGSNWRYQDIDGPDTDTTTVTISGKTAKLDTILYYEAPTVNRAGKDTTYFGKTNHEYYTYDIDDNSGDTKVLYLYDNQPVGYTWSRQFPSVGSLFSGSYTGKIIEKDITKTVLDKTYSGIIHSQTTLKITLFGINTTVITDYYVAKRIGIIEADTNNGGEISTTKLISYTIK